jgi:alpha-tubulin suppressor-like RCC1 family protein
MPVVSEPTAVPGLPAVERIYPGYEHCCARTVGTRVPHCWGANEHGQVGINTTSPFEPASAVIGNQAIDTMSPGYRHTCLTTQDDLVAYCWGANDLGQFSGVPGPDQPLPSPEPALDGVPFSMRQAEHGCGLHPSGIRCWGANDSGQLGNGKIENYGPASDVTFTP